MAYRRISLSLKEDVLDLFDEDQVPKFKNRSNAIQNAMVQAMSEREVPTINNKASIIFIVSVDCDASAMIHQDLWKMERNYNWVTRESFKVSGSEKQYIKTFRMDGITEIGPMVDILRRFMRIKGVIQSKMMMVEDDGIVRVIEW